MFTSYAELLIIRKWNYKLLIFKIKTRSISLLCFCLLNAICIILTFSSMSSILCSWIHYFASKCNCFCFSYLQFKCVFQPGHGWNKGGYQCHCRNGYFSPSVSYSSNHNQHFFNGIDVERAWEEKIYKGKR